MSVDNILIVDESNRYINIALVMFMDSIEIVPAILSKNKEDLMQKINSVPDANILQIDLMDNIFVPNKTVGVESLDELPNKIIEYHLMVSNPISWIEKLPSGKRHIFQVHFESINKEQILELKKLIEKKDSRLAWALNPPTDVEVLDEYMDGVGEVLVMTVNPGFSGQSYINECEEKMRYLRKRYPDLIIEVDGGVTKTTLPTAKKAGANRFATASALFKTNNANESLIEFREFANKDK